MSDAIRRDRKLTRRKFLAGSAGLVGAAALTTGHRESLYAQGTAPAVVTPDAARPTFPSGVQSGDVVGDRAMVWSRTDRPSRMVVEVSTQQSFANARRMVGPAALADSDFTARVDLTGLPADADIFYRVLFQNLQDPKVWSAPMLGSFHTPPTKRRTVTFAWSGDEAGQGWGINLDLGGYKLYEAMRKDKPEFFIHSGDQIYADSPIQAEVKLPNGSMWKNVTTPEKAHVAQTLADFRGAFAYNLLDNNKLRFCAEVPFLAQWDDHETRNNWYPGQQLGDPRYTTERSASLLSAYARRAMFEYNAMRFDPIDPERIYRAISWGPSLDVFMLDERSYRGPNSPNVQTALDQDAAFLGPSQLEWLKQSLKRSKATWKVIASDMPISLVVPDLNPDVPKGTFEAWANGDPGAPAGRELELAALFKFIKANKIQNVVWVTADVHYAQALYYSPQKAKFTEFLPFWEFVAGPINAGTYGPNAIDPTFGPEEKFCSIPKDSTQNRSPAEDKQYYGLVKVDGQTQAMIVSLRDLHGTELYKVTLAPQP
jgi:alkaline phosphatase D